MKIGDLVKVKNKEVSLDTAKKYLGHVGVIDVTDELSNEQLEIVRGGMDASFYGVWRSSVINESW